ncbi:MAG: hypothetical protein AB8B50_16975 [Pirellulaceae bacterium]
MNFFSWLRDGVRQSVLLGVSDAVEQLGTPEQQELHPSVSGFLQLDRNASPPKSLPGKTKQSGSRKRLGKSLKDMGTEAKT